MVCDAGSRRGQLCRGRIGGLARLCPASAGACADRAESAASESSRGKTAKHPAAQRHPRLPPGAPGLLAARLAARHGALCPHGLRPGKRGAQMSRPVRSLVLLMAVFSSAAYAQSPQGLEWLRKIHDATLKLSYKGTFVYQHDGRTETSRITRYVDG